MPYLQRGSSRYWITIPTRTRGKYAHVATGTRDHGTAVAMEAMLSAIGPAGSRQLDLIDAVLAGRCSLPRLHDHHVAGTFAQLRRELDDIDVAPGVEEWRKTISQRHRGESVRKYPRWSEALFPLDEQVASPFRHTRLTR